MRSYIVCCLLINFLLLVKVRSYEDSNIDVIACMGQIYNDNSWRLIYPCPSGVIQYKMLTGSYFGYEGAFTACKEQGMMLFSIGSYYDVQFIKNQLKCKLSVTEHFLLGLRYVDGKLKFDDGTETRFFSTQFNITKEELQADNCFSVTLKNDLPYILPGSCKSDEKTVLCKKQISDAVQFTEMSSQEGVAALLIGLNALLLFLACFFALFRDSKTTAKDFKPGKKRKMKREKDKRKKKSHERKYGKKREVRIDMEVAESKAASDSKSEKDLSAEAEPEEKSFEQSSETKDNGEKHATIESSSTPRTTASLTPAPPSPEMLTPLTSSPPLTPNASVQPPAPPSALTVPPPPLNPDTSVSPSVVSPPPPPLGSAASVQPSSPFPPPAPPPGPGAPAPPPAPGAPTPSGGPPPPNGSSIPSGPPIPGGPPPPASGGGGAPPPPPPPVLTSKPVVIIKKSGVSKPPAEKPPPSSGTDLNEAILAAVRKRTGK